MSPCSKLGIGFPVGVAVPLMKRAERVFDRALLRFRQDHPPVLYDIGKLVAGLEAQRGPNGLGNCSLGLGGQLAGDHKGVSMTVLKVRIFLAHGKAPIPLSCSQPLRRWSLR